MGTNYYWIYESEEYTLPDKRRVIAGVPREDRHLGKLSAVKDGCSFTWAHSPAYIFAGLAWYCKAENMLLRLIEDEYGRLYTAREFIEIVEECKTWDLSLIGEVFS